MFLHDRDSGELVAKVFDGKRSQEQIVEPVTGRRVRIGRSAGKGMILSIARATVAACERI